LIAALCTVNMLVIRVVSADGCVRFPCRIRKEPGY
jgi:hypothetical protein